MSRDPRRIDILLDALGELWKKNPDLRLGQLIENITPHRDAAGIFFLEDPEFLYMIIRALESNEDE